MSYVATRTGYGVVGGKVVVGDGTDDGTTTDESFNCRGGEFKSLSNGATARQEGCCPDTTWTEATYRAVKGDSSTQHYLEQRIHDACGYMTAEWISNVAWDVPAEQVQASVPSTLVVRAASAVQNFKDLFQPDRWVRNPQGAETDCTSSGYYATWEDRGLPRPEVQQAAIKRIIGASYTQEKLAQLTEKLKAVIWGVPRNSDFSYAQPGLIEKDLFVVQNGQVVTTPWMTLFLDALSPAAVSSSIASSSRLVSKTVAVSKQVAISKQVKPSTKKINTIRQTQIQRTIANQRKAIAEEQGEASSSVVPYVVAGAGVALIAGAIWYFKFRK